MANTNEDFSMLDFLDALDGYPTIGEQSRGSIEYVRVKEIDDKKPGQLIYGTVILTDSGGDEVVYHRSSIYAESKGPGEYLSLTGPSRPIVASTDFSISVNLCVRWCGQGPKEIANGMVRWDPTGDGDSVGKPLEAIIRGKHGSVTVGFSIIKKAFRATINVVMNNEFPAQIYGTIKAVRFLGESTSSGESTITQMLFEKSANEWVQVNPQQSLPLTRPAVFPVAVDSELTIAVDLWNVANDQIALGSLQFTSIGSSQRQTITGKYGEVQVDITFD